MDYKSDGPEAQRIARTIPYYPFKGIERFYDIGGEGHVKPSARCGKSLLASLITKFLRGPCLEHH